MTPEHKTAWQDVLIEHATPEDAEVICNIRDRAWIATYPNAELGITAKDIELNAIGLNGEFLPRRIAYFKNKLTMAERIDGATYVARLDGKVVGFVDPSIEQGKRRIGALYVSPEVQGRGIGSKLMQQAIDWHGKNEDIIVEVVAYNRKAITFYERYGFTQTDTIVPLEPNRPDYMKSLPIVEMVLRATHY